MIIYDFLFYHTYYLALKSKANKSQPLYLPIGIVSVCLVLNLTAILFLLQGIGWLPKFSFGNYKFILAPMTVIAVAFYFLHFDRYAKVLKKFGGSTKQKNRSGIGLSIVILIAYYLISFALLLLAGMFRNKDGIFG